MHKLTLAGFADLFSLDGNLKKLKSLSDKLGQFQYILNLWIIKARNRIKS